MAASNKSNDIYESTVDYAGINANIKKYRQKANLTQFELAEKSHVTPKYLSRLENNYYKAHLHIYMQIASALNISICDLTGEKNEDDEFIRKIKILTANMTENQKDMVLENINVIKKYIF